MSILAAVSSCSTSGARKDISCRNVMMFLTLTDKNHLESIDLFESLDTISVNT